MNLWGTMAFTAEVVTPIFFIILLGVFLRHVRVIDDGFVNTASRVVFLVALPALIFFSIAPTDFLSLLRLDVIAFFYAGTLVTVGLIWWLSGLFIRDAADRGAFVQGSFRSNFGIVGLALCVNAFGEYGLAFGAMLLAFLIPLYNVLSILVLTPARSTAIKPPWWRPLLEIVRNPLILAVIFGLFFSIFAIPLPAVIEKTGDYFARLTLPLALLASGGALTLNGLALNRLISASRLALSAAAVKLIGLPAVLTLGALACGFEGRAVGVLFIAFASPTAAASFVMARVMGANAELSGHIIVVTTLASILTIGTGLFLLKIGGVF